MPEGPEVEVIRQGLLDIVGSEIKEVRVSANIKYKSQYKKLMSLEGESIKEIKRKGKFLLWYFSDKKSGLVGLNHLGMTGVWYLFSDRVWKKIENPFEEFKHYKLYFIIAPSHHLLFSDVRTFGRFQLFSKTEIQAHPSIANLGPDILDQPFNSKEFLKRVRGVGRPRTAQIGKLLLDYNVVAGCGNIYKSEALYRAKVHPMTATNLLQDEQIKEIGKQLSIVGHEAVKSKGTSIQNYRYLNGYKGLMQNKLKVYGLAGSPCAECGETIVAGKQGDRTSFWCPTCQPSPVIHS
jgi:formamidopyrimidine-DNA glycosylase